MVLRAEEEWNELKSLLLGEIESSAFGEELCSQSFFHSDTGFYILIAHQQAPCLVNTYAKRSFCDDRIELVWWLRDATRSSTFGTMAKGFYENLCLLSDSV
jgi:hypothetical protein